MVDLAALRESLRRLQPGAAPLGAESRDAVGSGFTALDRALTWGGFPRGAVTELCGAPSSGKTALALTALAAHTRRGGLAVYVDGGRQLFPPSAAALGVALDRLLVVKPSAELDGESLALAAAQAAEIVARSGAFALIALDLPPGAQLTRAPAARVRGAMQRAGSVALVIGPARPGQAVFDGALARLSARSRGRRIAVTIVKGGHGGEVVELELEPVRLDERPGTPVAAASRRLAPGTEAP